MSGRVARTRRRELPALLGLAVVVLLLPVVPGTGAHTASAPLQGAPSSARPPIDLPRPADRAHPPLRRPMAPPTATIDPTSLYTAEPAPMGINDFGVDSGGSGYRYNTSAFLGFAAIQSLAVYDVDNTGYEATLTIQQNVCLEFWAGGVEYQYWIQNVVFLDTSQNQTAWENNIWNLSGPSAGLDTNSVRGNGSVEDDEVYIWEPTTAGATATLTYPSALGFLVVAGTKNNLPTVAFEYKDGPHWVTYDNVVFPFATGANGTEFVVDGTNYAPDGLFDDAELILGGPGGGATTQATSLNLTLSMSYYNGHNYQAIRNAYDFGSDTAESISNVQVAKASTANSNASLGVALTTGTSALGLTYGNSYSSVVAVSSPVSGGALIVGNAPPIPFSGTSFNVTLAPGTYTCYLDNATGSVAAASLKVPTGGSTSLTFTLAPQYTVRFTEEDLSQNRLNQTWNLTFGGVSYRTNETSFTFFMVNGSYAYAVPRLPGFILNASTGNVLVSGSGTDIVLDYYVVVYAVSLYETGLPLGTNWSIGVYGAVHSSTGVLISFDLPNGTFTYTLGLVAGWTAAPSAHAQIAIRASAFGETLAYRQFTYPIVSAESGLPSGTLWGIAIGSNTTVGSFFALRTNEPNGSYTYRVNPPTGWYARVPSGRLDVNATNVTLNITFLPFTYPVEFTETGLSAGTVWSVTIGKAQYNASNATFDVLLGNGSYSYTVLALPGYDAPSPSKGTVDVAKGASPVSIVFTLIPVVNGTLVGSITTAGATLSVNGVLQPLSDGAFDLSLAPGVYAIEISASGFVPYFHNYTVTSGGRTQVLPITLQPSGTNVGPPGGGPAGSTGTPGFTSVELAAVAALAIGTVAVVGLLLWRRRPRA